MATLAFKAGGEALLLIGGQGKHLGQSLYLRENLGREEGPPPPVDLAAEKRHGDFVRALIRSGQVTAVHDISDGGLIAAVVEMALAGRLGVSLELPEGDAHVALFAEDQARYLVTAPPHAVEELLESARTAGVPAERLGTVGGDALIVAGKVSISLDELSTAHEGWFPAFMDGPAS
jgi:phosphoribosylformylglycinamidine synthase